ncbi:hypothetical protein P3C58_14720 [Mesorhizobium sp. XAP10]|uniref:hypothetical protein n=1 Tax=unclassified Mesorhizobium TaxID=325217 RepID=UPI0023DFD072|nr:MULTISPECIES: hypothetical protein [unclassified Mesorhizobium]MDF3153228.1 hypothetical protein [Mesorhizobium sp. XAP10]MDF3246474.1 hypothetical protein [Mesorhizobium sp. XAP4]
MENNAQTIFQILGTAGTLAAAIAAWLTAREMRRQSKNSVRPYPVLIGHRFERRIPAEENSSETFLALENVGQGPMLNVTISWEINNLLRSLPNSFKLHKSGKSVEYANNAYSAYYVLGDALNFRKSHITSGINTDVHVPTVVMSIIDENMNDHFGNNSFNDFNIPYIFAKLEYNDIFENKYIFYYKLYADIIMYSKNEEISNYDAEWKTLQSQHLEF